MGDDGAPRAVNNQIGIAAANAEALHRLGAAGEFDHRLHRIDLGQVDGGIGTEGFGHTQPAFGSVDRDNAAIHRRPNGLDTAEADNAGTEHHHCLAVDGLAKRHAVQGGRQGFEGGAVLEADRLRQNVGAALGNRHRHVLRKAALPHAGDAVTDPETADFLSHLNDLAAQFVTHNAPVVVDRAPQHLEHAEPVHVQVGAANAARLHAYQHVVVADGRARHLFYPNVPAARDKRLLSSACGVPFGRSCWVA